jgi:hypothetical protein
VTLIPLPNLDDITFDALTTTTPVRVNRSSWTSRRKVVGQPGTEIWRGEVTI